MLESVGDLAGRLQQLGVTTSCGFGSEDGVHMIGGSIQCDRDGPIGPLDLQGERCWSQKREPLVRSTDQDLPKLLKAIFALRLKT